jgi:ABC-type glycerol-3-phosphate transport system substrate-binding protein
MNPKTVFSRRMFLRSAAVWAGTAALAACQPKVVEKVVKETVEVEKEVEKVVKETVVVEKSVEKVVEKAVDTIILRWHARLGNVWKVYPERVKAFEEAHPGVKVNLEEFPAGSAEFGPKIAAMVAAGAAGDLCWTAIGSGSFQFLAQNKALASLEDVIAADPLFKAEDFYPRVLNSFRMGPNGMGSGDLLGLPELAHGTYQCLFFNKDLLESMGLDLPTNDWTREQLLDTAIKATKDGIFGFLPTTGGYSEIRHTTLAFGGELMSADGKQSLIEDEEVKMATRWLHDAFFKLHVAPLPQEVTGGRNQMFLSQRLALFQSGHWDLSSMDGLVKDAFTWDMVLTPAGPAGTRGGHLHADSESVLTQSENKQLAYELGRTLTDHEGSVGITIQIGSSCRPATYEDERVRAAQPYWGLIAQSIEEAAAELGPANLRKQESQTLIKTMFDPLWVGDREPDDAFFDEVSAEWQDFLDKPAE